MTPRAAKKQQGRALSPTFSVRDAEAAMDPSAVRVAGQLRDSGRTVVGVLPTSDDVVAWPLVLALALAMVKASGKATVIIDMEQRWPPMTPALDEEAVTDVLPAGEEIDLVERRLLTGRLMLLTPREKVPTGAKVEMLKLMLGFLRAGGTAAYVFIDLTGFEDRIGEFLGTMDLVEGVIVAARAGVSREGDLGRVHRELPPEKSLGVLLLA
jgi:hypothetical protein